MSSKKRNHSDREGEDDCDESGVNLSEDDELETSNITKCEPFEGMRLEIRDSDYIWSSGYIVKVIRSKGKRTTVTVASDGWGREWDEIMQWPNDRLAKLYTYTKQVKCNLDLLPKVKNRKLSKQELDKLTKNSKAQHSTFWPVTVQFRMPHPGVKHARETLRLEDKVFVKPYAIRHLPNEVQKLMIHDDGCWFHHSKLRLWKEDPRILGILHPNYMRAWKVAQQDRDVVGYFSPKALDASSLLHEVYRIHDIRGCSKFDGALRETEIPVKRSRLELIEDEEDGDDNRSEKPPSVVAFHGIVEGHDDKKKLYSEPPQLPPPIRIIDPLFPNGGVLKCKKSDQWVASVAMNGNQVFLGSFPTESQAWLAIRKAKGESDIKIPQTLSDALQTDLQSVSMEAIIDAFEANYDPSVHNFSLHNWTLAKINHYCSQQENKGAKPSMQNNLLYLRANSHRMSKRKGIPRRIQRDAFV